MTDPMYNLAVMLPGGLRLRYLPNRPPHQSWTADDPRDDEDGSKNRAIVQALSRAAAVTERYEYGAQDGYPGYRLTQMVADVVGGEAILPPLPPTPKGVQF